MKKNHTFTQFARREAASASCALLSRYEERDRLKYIEGPKIEDQYMQRIGDYERTVVLEELEVEILLKAKEFIQTAINRREPVDEEVLNKLMEGHRNSVIQSGSAGGSKQKKLTDEEEADLQETYRRIVQQFHPGTHPDQTEIQNILFEKANQAYKDQNIELLNLIYDMLTKDFSAGDGISISIEAKIIMLPDEPEDTTDFTLAAEIFDSFVPTVEEANLMDETELYISQINGVLEEIEAIKSRFPFNTVELLNNPEKLETYRNKLDFRMELAKNRRKELEQDIEEMKERAKAYE